MRFNSFQALFTLWLIFNQITIENPESCNLFSKPCLPSNWFSVRRRLKIRRIVTFLYKPCLLLNRFSIRRRLKIRRIVAFLYRPCLLLNRFSIRQRLKIRKIVTLFQVLFNLKPIFTTGSVGLIRFKPCLPSGRFSVRYRLKVRKAVTVLGWLCLRFQFMPYLPSNQFLIGYWLFFKRAFRCRSVFSDFSLRFRLECFRVVSGLLQDSVPPEN